MGYMSNVVIILTEGAYKRFKSKFSAVKNTDKKKSLTEFLSNATMLMNNKNHDVLIEFPSIKWYPDDPVYYPDVYFIDQFLNTVPMEEYRYIRLGEELGDVEQYGSYYQSNFCETGKQKITYNKRNCTEIGLG